jgi:hypothetical protein
MVKATWIAVECDETALIETLNDLESNGYVPWKWSEVADYQDPVNKRQVRVLARLRSEHIAVVLTKDL